jgi:hypothetical protein
MMESLIYDVPVVAIGMPEVLLRMKIGHDLLLKELEEIFNIICNKINQKTCVPFGPVAA